MDNNGIRNRHRNRKRETLLPVSFLHAIAVSYRVFFGGDRVRSRNQNKTEKEKRKGNKDRKNTYLVHVDKKGRINREREVVTTPSLACHARTVEGSTGPC